MGDDLSISISGTLCDQELLPGEANLQETPVFQDAPSKRFNCTSIMIGDGSTAACRQLGARIDPYPGN